MFFFSFRTRIASISAPGEANGWLADSQSNNCCHISLASPARHNRRNLHRVQIVDGARGLPTGRQCESHLEKGFKSRNNPTPRAAREHAKSGSANLLPKPPPRQVCTHITHTHLGAVGWFFWLANKLQTEPYRTGTDVIESDGWFRLCLRLWRPERMVGCYCQQFPRHHHLHRSPTWAYIRVDRLGASRKAHPIRSSSSLRTLPPIRCSFRDGSLRLLRGKTVPVGHFQ